RATAGKVLRRGVGRSRTDAVVRTARRHATTPYAVLLTAYCAALARVLGCRELVVGSPVTGRDRPELDATIGMFVNTVCLRAVVGEDESYGSLLRQITRGTREALAHQSYPFERLVDRLELPRDLARNPLFDAYFALQNIDFHAFHRGGLDIAVDVLNPGTTRFDLNLQAYQRPSGLVLDLEYASDLYERSTAEHLLRVFLGLLEGLAENPHRPVLPPRSVALVPDTPDFDF
ncbi:condensation domain-containing protein, partial [Streptomyces sp. W16]|uniref:condensation domain-containing protein n=1 Tax=Streptomyces sp. W16 TaxID=3076631 RepID=UPI00295B6B13